MSHTHLDKIQAVNLGSFYTPDFVVQIAQKMLLNALYKSGVNLKNCTLLDSSCGYGNFLDFSGVDFGLESAKIANVKTQDFMADSKRECRESCMHDFALKIGIDIDKEAIKIAKSNFASKQNNLQNPPLFLRQNALQNVSRNAFKIPQDSPLAVIGNPPYNDKTSIIQKSIKDKTYALDSHLKCRDIGASFLLSFNELKADFICVLHPLSYLIKETNFKALRRFFTHYTLLDCLVISSQIFTPKSLSFFPIVIALYTRSKTPKTPDFSAIKAYRFHTLEGQSFALNDFDFIAKYIDKYPNKSRVPDENAVALFYTLRDINALARSKTFLAKPTANAINVPREKFSLYCYVDVFKQMIGKVPYYLGNCDIFIDLQAFKILESKFVECAKSKIITPNIARYFERLLGEHYADSQA
ncbi:Eco57I restriction-modification methylase domain-containing protein [Helicobacter sp. T3_23-1056]